jgi:hypothetical protein
VLVAHDGNQLPFGELRSRFLRLIVEEEDSMPHRLLTLVDRERYPTNYDALGRRAQMDIPPESPSQHDAGCVLLAFLRRPSRLEGWGCDRGLGSSDQLGEPLPERGVIPASRLVSDAGPVNADQPAGATFRQSKALLEEAHCSATRRGPEKFFRKSSRSIWLSSAWSATRRLSRLFSSSSCFRRLASPTSSPPDFFFQVEKVCSLIPWRRHSSAVGAPASCSFRMPTICSSVTLLLPMLPPRRILREDARNKWTSFWGAGHRRQV